MVQMGIFWYGTIGYIVVWYSRVHLCGTANFSLHCAVQCSAFCNSRFAPPGVTPTRGAPVRLTRVGEDRMLDTVNIVRYQSSWHCPFFKTL